MSVKPFFDTNILVYAFSQDDPRSEVARILLITGGIISVQVLNELTSILRRKLNLSCEDVSEALVAVRTLCPSIGSLTVDTHDVALKIAERYGYRIYDSLIIAAALAAKTVTLYSEDMNDGQVIEDVLTIKNPFNGKA
jgi:predicted nucleic acid-binding protein